VSGFLDGHYVDRAACDAAFLRMHQRDRIGDRVHLFLAFFGIIALFGPVTVTELAFAPLAVFFVVRVLNTFPVWIHGFGQPVVLSMLALAGWMMISLRWSGDPSLAWGEIGELRWLLLIGLLYPVIEKRGMLIAALCIGVLLGQLAQLAEVFNGFGIEPLAGVVSQYPGRISGWWHPVVGGSILVAALGLHLPAAVIGRGRWRGLGVLGSSITLVGIVAIETRGAWIAAVLLVVSAFGFALFTKRLRWKQGMLIALVGAITVASAGWVMRDALADRIGETRAEITQIIDGQYDSYTGARVRMGQLAIEAIESHPIVGVGAGGYQHWASTHDPDADVHAHAHNALLQIWSTLGLVGVVLWALVLATIWRSAWRLWDQTPSGVYRLGPAFALLGLMLVSLTDSVEINTQTAALLGLLAALSPAQRPHIDEPIKNE
jgi:O-antigen ligase